jgi:beta-lactamase superfamily II metal-dependent hydrolase
LEIVYEIDFLPVGDGEHSWDAIALRFTYPNPANDGQVVLVVDGGYQTTGTDLVKHIDQYYGTRRVDVLISTHPDADHVSGLEVVLDEMEVGEVLMHLPWEHVADLTKSLTDPSDKSLSAHLRKSLTGAAGLYIKAVRKRIPVTEPFAGLQRFGGALTVVGPSEPYYESLVGQFRGVSLLKAAAEAVKRLVGATVERVQEALYVETLNDFGETSAENNTSTILNLDLDGRRLLLTGDDGMPALSEAADYMDTLGMAVQPLMFMQVPHHGARHNVGPTVLNRLLGQPGGSVTGREAIVSVSADAPKLPSKQVTNAFLRRGAPVTPTQGRSICLPHDAPPRLNWGPVQPLPFFQEFESED